MTLDDEFTDKLNDLVAEHEARGLSHGSVVGLLIGYAVGVMRARAIREETMHAVFDEMVAASRDLGKQSS